MEVFLKDIIFFLRHYFFLRDIMLFFRILFERAEDQNAIERGL